MEVILFCIKKYAEYRGNGRRQKIIFDFLSIKALPNLTFATPRPTKNMPVAMGQRLLILVLLEFPLPPALGD